MVSRMLSTVPSESEDEIDSGEESENNLDGSSFCAKHVQSSTLTLKALQIPGEQSNDANESVQETCPYQKCATVSR